MDKAKAIVWSDEFTPQIEELAKLASKYKFKDGLELVESMTQKLKSNG